MAGLGALGSPSPAVAGAGLSALERGEGLVWIAIGHALLLLLLASEGYRERLLGLGVPAERLAVTGIPNFDCCQRYRDNDFPLRDFVLVCASDARETSKRDDRTAFLERAVRIAAGRPLVVELHPFERHDRARAEVARWAPGARVYDAGCAGEMVANCSVLACQWSTLAFVGLALGKEVQSFHPAHQLRRLLPLQNGRAAANVAEVCREALGDEVPRRQAPARHDSGLPPALAQPGCSLAEAAE